MKMPRWHWRVATVLAAGVIVVATAGALPAGASLGAGISASPVTLQESAKPGQHYDLGTVKVVNTGTEPSAYALRIDAANGGRQVPRSWVRFSPDTVQLAPKASTAVNVALRIPKQQAAGEYRALIVAHTVALRRAAGAGVGAAAATKLSFRVRNAGRRLPMPPTWVTLTFLSLIGIVVVTLFLRRLGVSVQVERRR